MASSGRTRYAVRPWRATVLSVARPHQRGHPYAARGYHIPSDAGELGHDMYGNERLSPRRS